MADLKPGVLSETTVLNKETRKYSYLDLIKTPQMRRLTLLTGILFGVSCTYYGISLNVAGFGVNIFVTQFIYGVIEIPAKIFICFTLNKIGRRMNQAGTLVLTGLCIFCNIFIPQEMTIFRTTVGTLGKMFAEGAFTMVFLYTSELYPTVIRQSGLGYSSFMALTGVSVSPLIMVLELWLPLPGIVFSLVAFAAGLSACLLSETHNSRLPETIEDVEATMKFENILADIDGFGRFQIMIIVISFIGRFTLPCHFMLNNFVAAVPSHHCDISSLDDGGFFSSLSQAERLIVSIPVQEDGTPASCQMFAEPQYHLLLNSSNIIEVPTVPCQNGWVYDNTTFKSTLTSQWDLVCDKRGKNKATATIFFVGVWPKDHAVGVLCVWNALCYCKCFFLSYLMFAVLRFFTGFCITGIVIVSAVLSVEWVDIKHRKLVGVIDSLSWTFGNTVFAAIAYFVNDWRWLILSVTSPLILAIITWRVCKVAHCQRKAEGRSDVFEKCAKMNRTEDSIQTLNTETLATIVVTEKEIGPIPTSI
ncbi:hypothetical protein F7725_005696 [Dissostichus mawsoni]|uniref:Uncharacterized protein n=1 Tax=Dissostichus mawsoni TaxID=36200 RepID=A0A7J5YU25_DISMA|nr:hypothetical protein F7725_005696 [Dissostichus mawsoni]